MVENNFNKIIDAYKDIKMTHDEKREVFKQTMLVIEKIQAVSLAHGDLRKAIRPIGVDIVEEGQLSLEATAQSAGGNGNRGFRRAAKVWITYMRQRQFVPAMLASFVLLFTGGASLLAEAALPGDSLYSFKVNVNEPIRELAAVGAESKAHLAVEVSERRLQEATLLSARGELDESNKAILQDQFIKSATQIRNQVASLVSENDLDAAQEVVVDFESALKTHEKVLTSFAASGIIPVISPTSTDPVSGDPTNGDASSTPVTGGTVDAGIPPIIMDPTNASPTPDATISINATVVPALGADGKPITPTSSAPSIKPVSAKVPAASGTSVNSLLKVVQAELATTKISRINIEEKANTEITQTETQSPLSNQALIDAKVKDIAFTMTDIEAQLTSFQHASGTIEFARKRLGQASSTIPKIHELAKKNMNKEAFTEIRNISKSLSELSVILKLEKSSKSKVGTGGSFIDVAALILDFENASPTDAVGPAGPGVSTQ